VGRTVFYARVSTQDQKLDVQLDAARKLGVKMADIYVEKASGARHDRPVLSKALAALEPGDTLACYKLDRIGRSLVQVSRLIEELEERGVHFETVEDGLSTQGSTGKLVLHVLGAVAQFERDLILERTRAGLAAARKRGTRYCAKCGFEMRPFSNSMDSNSAPPSPMMFAPMTWLRRPSGFTMAPHSNAVTTRTTRTSPEFWWTAISAKVAT